MDQLLDILNEINSDVDYEICDTLIDDGIFSSFDIVSLVGELNDAFDIDITHDCGGIYSLAKSNSASRI